MGLGDEFYSVTISAYHIAHRLYKSLGDFDSLCGIFSSEIGTKAITSDALEAEERGDYPRALQLYKEVCNYTTVICRVMQHACRNDYYFNIGITGLKL